MAFLPGNIFIQKKKNEFSQRIIKVKHVSRKGFRLWKKEAITLMQQSNTPRKVFVFERLKYIGDEGNIPKRSKDSDLYEYRIGYYIVGEIGNKKSKWTWGQYCPFIPAKDFYNLIKLAEEEGTILKRQT